MKSINLTVAIVSDLITIQKSISQRRPLTKKQEKSFFKFIAQITICNTLLPITDGIEVSTWDVDKLNTSLENWEKLFWNIPGWDYAPMCIIYDDDASDQLRQDIIMGVVFAPSMAYNTLRGKEGYEVHLKNDGTAKFWFPTFEDAEQYPELYNFKGSWKEAYYLLIETLKKGWPMEEFPKELLPLLKK